MGANDPKKTGIAMSLDGFREILQASSDAVIIAGEDGGILFWNQASERLFGYDSEEASRIKIIDLMPEEYHRRHKKGFGDFIKTGKGRLMGKTVIVKARRRDGTVFPIELSLAGYKSGGRWAFAAIIRDITARRAYEHKLGRQSRLLAKANKELALLASISALLSQSMEFSELLKTILDTITRIDIFKLERSGGVFILRNGVLTLAAHLGHNDDFLAKHKAVKLGECLCGLAAETGEVITSMDSHQDPRHTITYEGMKPHAHIIVPLKAKDSVVGVLYLYLHKGIVVDSARKAFLESIGGILGVAISNSLLYEETRRLALHDPLTGLANKRLLNIELERNFVLAKRYERPFSCLMLDLDRFKLYNDSHGHVAGDRMLQKVARAITASLRETDFAARYGGEEFFVILPETAVESAALVAEKIRETVRTKTGITASLGAAAFDSRMSGPARLVESADRALYSAKKNGRDRVEVCLWP